MKRKFLTILTLMMILVLTMAFIACTDYEKPETPDEEEPETVTYSHVVKNGTFYDVTSTDKDGVYDKATSWTVTAAGLSVPANGKDSAGGVFAAALDLTGSKINSVLNEYKIESEETANDEGQFEDLPEPIVFANPGVDAATPKTDKRDDNGKVITGEGAAKVDQDTNAFLLASTNTTSSIYLKSSGITLDKNSVYKFQFSVCSKVEKETSGAFVFIRGDMEKEFYAINTDGAWETTTFYIETNKTSDMTITVELWLGYGPKKSTSTSIDSTTKKAYNADGNDKYATRGFALFDNVIATKLVDAETELDETMALFSSVYADYDKDISLHENFLNFADEETDDVKTFDTYSAYYMEDTDFAIRSHLTSSSYYGDASTYRKYFYGARDYSSANTSSTYWAKTSDFTAESDFNGIINLRNLYTADGKTNYLVSSTESKMPKRLMSNEDWQTKVMEGNRAFDDAKETFVLMIYNDSLGASGFYSADSNSLTVDSNKCYEISVWTYVWATEFTGNDAYDGVKSVLPAYNIAYNKTAPTAPTDPKGTWTAYKKTVYKLHEDTKDNANHLLKEKVDYFKELTTEEKAKFASFKASGFMGESETDENGFMSKVDPNSATAETYYKEMLKEVKDWLVTTYGAADADEATAKNFLYAYLYFNYNAQNDVLGASASQFDQAKLIELGFTSDWITAAYLQERQSNINQISSLSGEMDTFDKEYKEYEKKKADYDREKKAYDDECDAWVKAHGNKPQATFRISGAGDDYDVKSTKTDEWEKLTVYVRGNQLSSRTVALNLLFGENKDAELKMIGGVFFDDIEIKEIEYDENKAWHILSEIADIQEVSFGGLVSDDSKETLQEKLVDGTEETNPLWKKEKAEGTAANDASKISLSVETEEALQGVLIGDVTYPSYKLVYKHTDATASTLVYEPADENLVAIKPNKYYRFAFQVKTDGLTSDKGLDISLLKKVAGGEYSDFDTSITNYVSEEDWTEVVYYIRGDRRETYYLTVEFGMGDGTRFNKDSYVQAETWIASFNCLEITSDEYTAAKTGDKIVKSLSLSSTSYDVDGGKISNASYSTINYDKASEEDLNNEEGIANGSVILPASSWTQGTAINNVFETPQATVDNGVVTWEQVTGYENDNLIYSDRYEVWAKYKDTNNKDKTVILAVVSDALTYDLKGMDGYENIMDFSVAVKAVNEKAVSPMSSYVAVAGQGSKNVKPATQGDAKAKELKAGAKKITDDFDGSEYMSYYDSIYTIQSPYNAAVAVASDSLSLSANTFYKISVWVKTSGAKAAVTLSGTDGSVDAVLSKDGALGYSGIDTDGKWVEYNIYIQTGNFSISPKVNLCLGNPLAEIHKKTDADGKNYYNTADLSKGAVYFDTVRVAEIKESEYDEAVAAVQENNGIITPKYFYTDSESHAYTVQYTLDSFDSWEEKSTDADKYGNEPNNYDHKNGDNVTDSDAVSGNMTYGIYNANSTAENMKSALKYLYSNGSDNMLFNEYFSFAAEYTDADWSNFLKDFFDMDRAGKSGGNNVLVLSNKLGAGTAQKYSLNSSYKFSVAANGHYKLTFTAKTLIAKPVFTATTVSQDDVSAWATKKSNYYVKSGSTYTIATGDYTEGTTYYTVTYSMENCYAELRFNSGESNADVLKMYISSYDKDDEQYFGSGKDGEKTYTIYVKNPSASSTYSASWDFYLGDGASSAVDDNGMYNNLLVGMLAVDLVSMETIDKDAYEAGIKDYYDEDGEVVSDRSTVLRYVYAVDKDTSSKEEPNENDPEEETEKKDFWSNLVNDQYFWLYISSFVLGIVIIIVVIVVIVRKFKEKHPKKVVGENIVKTEKDIKVVEPEAQEKEEALEADEYVDEIKPVVQQRVLPKKAKKKKKK